MRSKGHARDIICCIPDIERDFTCFSIAFLDEIIAFVLVENQYTDPLVVIYSDIKRVVGFGATALPANFVDWSLKLDPFSFL